MAETKDAQEDTTETIVVPFSGLMADAQSFARQKAKEYAAERHRPVKVQVIQGLTSGKVIAESEQKPPQRPTDIVDKSTGKEQKEPPPTDTRIVDQNSRRTRVSNGRQGEGDEEGGSSENDGAISKFQPSTFLGNIPREISGNIAPMEGIMMEVPGKDVGKFTSLLPAVFRSLLPVGSIPGLTSKGPISLNGLVSLVGGAALGAAAGQALKSSAGGINAVSGLTGTLGAVALTKVMGAAGSQIPTNLTGGKTAYTGAVLSKVVGTVASVALKGSASGVPLTSQVLGLAANVALRSAATPLAIPTSVLGVATSLALKPISNILGVTGGRVPVLPTNLSLSNTGVLSGISQNIAPGLAENLIPRNQLLGLLPSNLQKKIPLISPRINNPFVKNSVSINRDASPERVPQSETFQKSSREEQKPYATKGTGTATNIAYEQKISANFSVGDLSKNAHFHHNIVPQNGLSVDQIITNLSALAVNCLEPIKSNYPGFTITSGFRGPGGTNPGGDHGHGRAADLQWGHLTTNAHLDIARWIASNLKFKKLIIEHSNATHKLWIHIAFEQGATGGRLLTMINNNYQSGLTNYFPTRLT